MLEQEMVLAGMEGERPQNKEGAFDAGLPQGAFTRGERYERSEVNISDTPKVVRRTRNGRPVDVVHLYRERQDDGQTRWWTERQTIEGWFEDVRAGKESGDPRYEEVPEDQVPDMISHSRSVPLAFHRGDAAPIYTQGDVVHIHYPISPTISILDSPEPLLEEPSDRTYSDDLHKRLAQRKREVQAEMESVGYYLSHMYRRAERDIKPERKFIHKANTDILSGQVRRVFEEAERFDAMEAKQKLEDLYWAFRAYQPLPKNSRLRNEAAIIDYNQQQDQWLKLEGEKREGIELTDPEVIEALSWLLDRAGIQHEAFDREHISVSFSQMEEEMRQFALQLGKKNEARYYDHEARSRVSRLMDEWQQKTDEGTSDNEV